MARYQNDPFPGTDYSRYLEWEKVTLPSGEVFYIVPNHPGYVFDPVASNASGRKVFRANPKQAIDEHQQQVDDQNRINDQNARNASPAGQVLPVVTSIGGIYAAHELTKGGPTATQVMKDGRILMSDGSIKGTDGTVTPPNTPTTTPNANAAAQGAGQGNPTTGSVTVPTSSNGAATSVAPGADIPEGYTVVGETADGGSLIAPTSEAGGRSLANGETANPDGTVTDASGATTGQWIQGATGALQVYSGIQQYKNGQKISGTANVIGGAANVYGGVTGTAVPGVGTAVAAANIGQNMVDDKGSSNDRAAASEAEGLKLALLYIPVYGQAAYLALAAADAASGGKATKFLVNRMKKHDSLHDKVDFGAGQWARNKLFHQSTRGVAMEHNNQIAEKWGLTDIPKEGTTDPKLAQEANYFNAMREQYTKDTPDPEHPFFGKYKTFDEYKTAGLDAMDLSGVYGNLKVYGSDWAALTPDQRRAVTQANIDSGIYTSKKGEVTITDETKAKENYDNVMKGFDVGVQTATTPAQGAAQGATGTTPPVTNAALPIVNPSLSGPAPITGGNTATNSPPIAPIGSNGPLPITGGTPPIVDPNTDNQRTTTRSPGIDLNGNPIPQPAPRNIPWYGRQLANRINARR